MRPGKRARQVPSRDADAVSCQPRASARSTLLRLRLPTSGVCRLVIHATSGPSAPFTPIDARVRMAMAAACPWVEGGGEGRSTGSLQLNPWACVSTRQYLAEHGAWNAMLAPIPTSTDTAVPIHRPSTAHSGAHVRPRVRHSGQHHAGPHPNLHQHSCPHQQPAATLTCLPVSVTVGSTAIKTPPNSQGSAMCQRRSPVYCRTGGYGRRAGGSMSA